MKERPALVLAGVQHGEDTEAGLREQIRFIQKAIGKSDREARRTHAG